MQTPAKVTLEYFYLMRSRFLKEECVTDEPSGWVVCQNCGTRLKVVEAQIEIHEGLSDTCRWNGEMFAAGIPYCPQCEELPANRGCVHA